MLQQLNYLAYEIGLKEPGPSRLGDCKTAYNLQVYFNYSSHEEAISGLPSGYDKTFIKSFGQSIANGDTTPANIANLSPKAASFCTSPNPNISVMYGGRIAKQERMVLSELEANPESRRAFINILTPEDKAMLQMAECAQLEFSCCIGYHFYIDCCKLNITVNMRSQNLYLLPIDLCNAIAVQEKYAKLLGYELGQQTFTFNNIHKYGAK